MSGEVDSSISPGELGPPEYLAYRVLWECHNQYNRETGRTQFHKLCCLTDQRLQEELTRDVGFPKHWYKYGRMAHEGLISDKIAFTPQANHKPGQAYYPANRVSESDFDHLSEELKDDIFTTAQEVVEEHGSKTANELEEYQYKNDAPNEFVEAYGDLRWRLSAQVVAQDNQSLGNFVPSHEKTSMEELLDKMLLSFPDEKYSEIYSEYLLWDDTFRLLHEQNYSPRVLKEFLETFILRLSRICLRFEDNSNIPPEEIEKWESEKPAEIEKLNREIEKKRDTAIESRSPTSELDSVSQSYNQTIEEEIEDL